MDPNRAISVLVKNVKELARIVDGDVEELELRKRFRVIARGDELFLSQRPHANTDTAPLRHRCRMG